MKKIKRLFGIGTSSRQERRRDARANRGISSGSRVESNSSADSTPRQSSSTSSSQGRRRPAWAQRWEQDRRPSPSSSRPARSQQEIDDEELARRLQWEEDRGFHGFMHGPREGPRAQHTTRGAGPAPGAVPEAGPFSDPFFRLILQPMMEPRHTVQQERRGWRSTDNSRRNILSRRNAATPEDPFFGWRRRSGTPEIRVRVNDRAGPSEDELMTFLQALVTRGFFENLLGAQQQDRGASQNEISNLKSYKHNPAKEKSSMSQCVICLSDFEKGDHVRKMKCNHIYHKSCLDEWLSTNATCPVCKAGLDGKPAES